MASLHRGSSEGFQRMGTAIGLGLLSWPGLQVQKHKQVDWGSWRVIFLICCRGAASGEGSRGPRDEANSSGSEEEEVKDQAIGRGGRGGPGTPWRWLAQGERRGGGKAGSGNVGNSSGPECVDDPLYPGG